MTIAAITSQNRRDERMAWPMPNAGGSVMAGLDIFFPLIGDQASGPHGEREQEQSKDHNIDQTGIEKLGGIALDEPNDQSGDDGAFDIAEAADNHNGEGFDDDGADSKGREQQNRPEHG